MFGQQTIKAFVMDTSETKTIWLERDYPVLGALGLWVFKVVFLGGLSVYNFSLVGSDIAFSGLAFDLWAFIALVVFNQPLADDGHAKLGEKILIGFFTVFHLLLFIALAIYPTTSPATGRWFAANVAAQILVVTFVTFAPPPCYSCDERFYGYREEEEIDVQVQGSCLLRRMDSPFISWVLVHQVCDWNRPLCAGCIWGHICRCCFLGCRSH